MSDVEQIADVYAQWTSDVEEGHYAEACALQSQALQDEMAAEAEDIFDYDAGMDSELADLRPSCALYLEAATPMEAPDTDIAIESIEVDGGKASATVGFSTWRFVKESSAWRISYLD